MRRIIYLLPWLIPALPALAAPQAPVRAISLAGTWHVRLDPADAGLGEKWYATALPGTLRLPGSLQAQGLGDDVSVNTKWTGGIVDRSWFTQPRFAPYREPGKVRVPFWLQPEKHYVGAAWYQREVTIPADWRGKRVVLHLQRPHWETRVWVDDREAGRRDSLAVPHEYDLTDFLTPGAHRLTIRVDNRMIVNVGENAHSVSDHTQSNWNGIVGELKLVATDRVWIEDVQVYPRVADRTARVVVRVGNRPGTAGTGTLLISAERVGSPATPALQPALVPARWGAGADATQPEVTLALGPDAPLWDEFNPALYRVTVRLYGVALQLHDAAPGELALDTRQVVFGLREIGTEGTQFTLNGRKIFLRGTLECCIFPLTGYPPTDVDSWKRIIGICKAHGLNHIRFHSWCPPEAAFAAADELGFYFHVECCAWTTVGDGGAFDTWVRQEADRMLRTYGNHPSFLLMAYGNEPSGRNQARFLGDLVKEWRAKDPRRKYTSAAGWPQLPENDYHVTPAPRIQAWGQGLRSRINARPPETTTDYRDFVQRFQVPVVSHEIGQWCVYPNFDEIGKYTGVLKAKNFEVFRDLLRANHQGDQAHDFLMASGKLQALAYKEEIESALRTPGFGGFQLLELHDFPGQGSALVGVLDPFWDSKPYLTPAEFHRFCAPTVPLARMAKRTWTQAETFRADLEIAHFGPAPLKDALPQWRILDDAGRVVRQGECARKTLPIGNGTSLGTVETKLADLPAPGRYRLVVGLAGTPIENDWSFWLYPERVETAAPADVLVADTLSEAALARLKEGGKVLLLAKPQSVRASATLGFSPVFWNTAWTGGQPPHTLGILCDPKHPLFAEFPTAYHTDWQWWEPLHGAAAMTLDGMPPALRPLVQPIDTWFEARRLGTLFEARVGPGRLMVCSMDLSTDLEKRPAARQLRRSLMRYLASDAFRPAVEVTPEQVRARFKEAPLLAKLGAAIHADSAQEGYEAEKAIDGDPDTMWHTAWGEGAPGFPHELVLDLKAPVTLAGCALLPRQEMQNGWIRDYAIYVSDDGKAWGEPVAQGSFEHNARRKTVRFAHRARGRYLRLVAKATFDGAAYASLAEIDIME